MLPERHAASDSVTRKARSADPPVARYTKVEETSDRISTRSAVHDILNATSAACDMGVSAAVELTRDHKYIRWASMGESLRRQPLRSLSFHGASVSALAMTVARPMLPCSRRSPTEGP